MGGGGPSPHDYPSPLPFSPHSTGESICSLTGRPSAPRAAITTSTVLSFGYRGAYGQAHNVRACAGWQTDCQRRAPQSQLPHSHHSGIAISALSISKLETRNGPFGDVGVFHTQKIALQGTLALWGAMALRLSPFFRRCVPPPRFGSFCAKSNMRKDF